MSKPFESLLASVDRRRVPREPRVVSAVALEREWDQQWDHLGSGTQPAYSCPWAARGMRCDCIRCAQDRAGR